METLNTIKPIPESYGRRFFGHFLEFISSALPTLKHISKSGSVVRFYLLLGENYLISDPVLADKILQNKDDRFIKNLGFWLRFVDIFGNGLVISEGSYWKRNRKIVAPAFQKRVMYKYLDHMVENARNLTDRWQKGSIVDIHSEMLSVTARVATNALFGFNIADGKMEKAVKDIQAQFAYRIRRPFLFQDSLPFPSNINFRKGMQYVEDVLSLCITERRSKPDDTVLSMLVHSIDEDGNKLSDVELRDETITLLLAGHDTTAIGLSWAFYLLTKHPEYWSQLKQEAEALYSKERISVDDVLGMSLTMGVIRETLRLYPPAYMVGRMALEDTQIGDFILPAGKGIVISPYILGSNPDDFTNPDQFKPERWTTEFIKKLRKGAFIPFGGGPRTCVGEIFAMMEMSIILSAVARKYRMDHIGKAPIPGTSITLVPKKPIKMQLISV